MSLRRPESFRFLTERYPQNRTSPSRNDRESNRQNQLRTVTRCDLRKILPTGTARLPIDRKCPAQFQIIQILKKIEVEQFDPAALRIQQSYPDRLRQLFKLKQSRMRRAVGPDKTVRAEVGIIRGVAEISSICPVFFSVGTFLPDAMVHPFPDEAPLNALYMIKQLKIFLQPAIAVSHRMGIFTKNNRAIIIWIPFDPFPQIRRGSIHWTDEISKPFIRQDPPAHIVHIIAKGSLIMDQPAVISKTDITGHCRVIGSV